MAVNLTKEEFKQYDGKDGHKAYVAVDGTVYDVTGVEAWQNGEHHGKPCWSGFVSSHHERTS